MTLISTNHLKLSSLPILNSNELRGGVRSTLERLTSLDTPSADPLLKDRASIFAALGMEPDPWQLEVMACEASRMFILASRQIGKSRTIANYALTEALLQPPNVLNIAPTILIFSPTLRQSAEMLRKVKEAYRGLRGDRLKINSKYKPRSLKKEIEELKTRGLRPEEMMVTDRELSFELVNGSRIICLPAKAENVAGYSPTLIIIDEAAKMPNDRIYLDTRPMLAATQGRMILLSTPYGKRGFFWESYKSVIDAEIDGKKPPWTIFKYTVEACPRIASQTDFLADEKLALGDDYYTQEYYVEFLDTVNAVFHYEDIQRALEKGKDLTDEDGMWFS